jgi:hypothetical protein
MVIDRYRRRGRLFVALGALLTSLVAVPAQAAPGDDGEGATDTLRAQLDAANRGYIEAQTAIEASRQSQAGLNNKLAETERRLAESGDTANGIAALAYRTTPLRTASALLDSISPEDFIDRATTINTMALRNDKHLREYSKLRKELTDSKRALDAEVAKQEQQLAEMAKRKADAEKAVGPKIADTNVGSTAAAARAAPRRSNGSYGSEGCTINDPTTTGCITPRMLNALQQTQAAGFDHYVACFRSGGKGEHPLGRACDFAAAPKGFGLTATGADKAYGDRLSSYFKANAGPLAVMYVIWYRQIWQVATGDTRAYSGCCDPASMHTNHVHLSVY